MHTGRNKNIGTCVITFHCGRLFVFLVGFDSLRGCTRRAGSLLAAFTSRLRINITMVTCYGICICYGVCVCAVCVCVCAVYVCAEYVQ